MPSKNPLNKYVEYFSRPLSLDRITYLNSLNVVEPEKVELYRDFALSLTLLLWDTYLGEDVISEEDDIKSHFNWCWKKNISNFATENIFFDMEGEHYYYFLRYFTRNFYQQKSKTENVLPKMVMFWEDVISYTKLKTHSEYDLFISVYKLQTKYFKNNFA